MSQEQFTSSIDPCLTFEDLPSLPVVEMVNHLGEREKGLVILPEGIGSELRVLSITSRRGANGDERFFTAGNHVRPEQSDELYNDVRPQILPIKDKLEFLTLSTLKRR